MSTAPEDTQLLLEDNTMLLNDHRKNGDTIPLWYIVMSRVTIVCLHFIYVFDIIAGFLLMKYDQPLTSEEIFLQESQLLLLLFFSAFLIGEFFDYTHYKFILTAIAKWLLIAPFNILLILDFFLLATIDEQSLQNRDGCLFDPTTNRTRVNTDLLNVNETFIVRNVELFVVHFRCDHVEAVLGRRLYYILGGYSIFMFLIESFYAFFDWSHVVKWTTKTGFIALALFFMSSLLYILIYHIEFLIRY